MGGTLLEGKCMLIAGVGAGLGCSIARAAAAEGADIVLVGRTQATLDELAAEIAAGAHRVLEVAADLTSPEDCVRVANTCESELGGVDALVYNAYSAGSGARLANADLDEWREVMEVNTFGALEMIKALLPTLERRRGSVVLVNSRQMRRPTNGAYAMSKAALLVVGQVLAHELGPSGIRVNSVVPGWMWAPPVQHRFAEIAAAGGPSPERQYDAVAGTFPLRRMPTADDVANAVVFLASDRAAAVTGQSLDVNGGEIFV